MLERFQDLYSTRSGDGRMSDHPAPELLRETTSGSLRRLADDLDSGRDIDRHDMDRLDLAARALTEVARRQGLRKRRSGPASVPSHISA